MKFLLPIALLALGAAAADSEPKSDCAAEDIVEACLTSQQAKFDDCGEADYNCKCAAQEAIATYVSFPSRSPTLSYTSSHPPCGPS